MKNKKKGNKNSTRKLRSPLKPSNILDAPARVYGVYKGSNTWPNRAEKAGFALRTLRAVDLPIAKVKTVFWQLSVQAVALQKTSKVKK